ncbi:MAG: DNA-processing protein DprA [Calditrichia bacterium]
MNLKRISRDEFVYGLLLLASLPNLGPVRIKKIVNKLGSPLDFFTLTTKKIAGLTGLNTSLINQLKKEVDETVAEKQWKRIKATNIEYVHYWEEAYPKKLKVLPDAPPILFYLGNPEVTNFSSITIVGTRTPSQYGINVTKKLVSELSLHHIPIVSGLARGIDSVAHMEAVSCGNITIAVLASGPDIIYPPENKKLAQQIQDSGLLISEFPPGTRPEPSYFTRRNRIISGLSDGVIIVEAAVKSGALITANYALEQNKEIFAIPGEITNPLSHGCLKLIQEGAKCIISLDDIFDELPYLKGTESSKQADLSLLTELQIKILDLLGNQTLHIDELHIKSGLDQSTLYSILLEMELDGYVQQLAGNMFCRN